MERLSAQAAGGRRMEAEELVKHFNHIIRVFLAPIVTFLLQFVIPGFQDALLAIPPIRFICLYVLAEQCHNFLLKSVLAPSKIACRFSNLEYHVSEEAKETLLHAARHALLYDDEAHSKYHQDLPVLGRILLSGPGAKRGKYQRSVASAVAAEVGASLLVLDSEVLTGLADSILGSSSASTPIGGAGDGVGEQGALSYLLSIFLSGGRQAFVMDALHRCVADMPPEPLVVYIDNVEETICSSERYHAFVSVFGRSTTPLWGAQPAHPDDPPGPRARPKRRVLIGGTALDNSPAARAKASKGSEGGGGGGALGALAGAGQDGDALGELGLPPFLLPSAAEIALGEELLTRASPRQRMASLFSTAVVLAPPREGKGLAAHWAQLEADERELDAADNHRTVKQLAASRHVTVPGPECEVYRRRPLARGEWAQVLAWAVSLRLAREPPIPPASEPAPPAAPAAAAEPPPPPSYSSFILGLLGPLDVEGKGSGERGVSSKFGYIAEIPPRKGARLQAKAGALARAGPAHPPAPPPPPAPLEVTAVDLEYGLRMSREGGHALRPAIRTDNVYEKRLLGELLLPEDAGAGFSDVGALELPKRALREAVQLPLQHPELFRKGGLASQLKGVLLFGPPGTGKTLLARAVAAECGASFLTVTPSSVQSKWLGDGVRYVRAVFSLARKAAPAVIFLDEVDAFLGKRNSTGEHEALREIKNEFMAQWDGGGGQPRVMVLAATNRPQDLDDAALRRFSRRILCDLPDKAGRRAVLEVLLAGDELAEDVEVGDVVAATEGYSGSDLMQVCRAAAMRPVRELLAATGKSATAAPPGAQPSAALAAGGDDTLAGAGAGAVVVAGGEGADGAKDGARGQLVADCEGLVAAGRAAAAPSLRPITARDLREAVKEVAASTAAEGAGMTELREWNQQFGEGGERGPNPKLSYFM